MMTEAKRFKNKYQLRTQAGVALTISYEDEALYLQDPLGGKARIDIGDVEQSNGIVHVIDAVLIPQVLILK